MITKTIKIFGATFLMLTLCACNGFFEKDNTPTPKLLVSFKEEFKPKLLWSTKAGSGVGDDYLKLTPAISSSAIFTTSAKGLITSVDKNTGRRNWQIAFQKHITTAPGSDGHVVAVGTRKGEVIVLDALTGRTLWQNTVPGEVLATPLVTDQYVIVKSVSGVLQAFNKANGNKLWNFEQSEPSLILRGSSMPVAQNNSLFAGYANGHLAKLNLRNGDLLWLKAIAQAQGGFAIQRMIDIDANPVVYRQHIYAATYQGKIAALNWYSGSTLWSRDISSYTGMVVDDSQVYISDAKSTVWSFDTATGETNWKQTQLTWRNITAPALINNTIVVGDAQGYLHWLDQKDGRFVARVKIGSPLYAPPVVDNNILYALANNGKLYAFTLMR